MPEAMLDQDDVVDTMADVRPGGRAPLVVRDVLTAFLDRQGLGSGDLIISRLGHGHSCETFSLRRTGLDAVLRRTPRPPLTTGVHNIEREIRILQALAGAARAPRVLAACSTAEVMGAPFLVMERVAGVVLDRELPAALDTPRERARIGEELADALAELHACDVPSLGLLDIGRATIDHASHMRSIQRLSEKSASQPVPDMLRLADWLATHLPQDIPTVPSLVHNDYRLGNVLFSTEAPARLTATLDWETALLGDPMLDVGFLVGLYRDKGDDSGFLTTLTHRSLGEGALSREQLAHRYALRSGRSLRQLNWYIAFALWRMAVIGQSLYRRFLDGLTNDPFYQTLEPAVPELAGRALAWVMGPNRFE